MDYAFSFLLKVSVSILWWVATFNIWKSSASSLFDWVMPFIAVFWIAITVFEGIKIKKGNKLFKEKEEQDERTLIHSYRAGYFTFWFNISVLTLFFFVYSIFGSIFNPLDALVVLVILNITVYYGIRLYLIFYK